MKNIGYLLLLASFLSMAFLASLDAREMNWTWFVPALIAGFAGVITVRRIKHAAASADHVLAAHREDLETSLDNIIATLETLNAKEADIPTYEMRFEIDKLLRDDLRNFADARDSLKHIYGIQAFADIMSNFAAGERYVNRVWSASADGYDEEANAYLVKAAGQFDEARQQLLKAAESIA